MIDTTSDAILHELRLALRAGGLRYRDVALHLGVSEVTIKRSLNARDLPLDRLLSICRLAGVEFAELAARAARRAEAAVYLLTTAEDDYFYHHRSEYAFLILLCAHGSVAKLEQKYGLKKATVARHLRRLEKMGFLEWLPEDRVRLLKGTSIDSPVNGKLRREQGRKTRESFLDGDFTGPLAHLDMSLIEVTSAGARAVSEALRRAISAVTEIHNEEESLPQERKNPLGVMVAVRPWTWDYLADLEDVLRES